MGAKIEAQGTAFSAFTEFAATPENHLGVSANESAAMCDGADISLAITTQTVA
jgi:hypothetical protein